MKQTKVAQPAQTFAPVSVVFASSEVGAALQAHYGMTALETLTAAIGKDKHARHALIVSKVGDILALALCKAPPKGIGSPADWKALADRFTAAKLTRYADAAAGFIPALKGKTRSVEAWEDAQATGLTLAENAFADCAPRSLSDEEQAKRTEKRAAKLAERTKTAKALEREERDMRRAELAQEYERGRAAAQAVPVLTADMVADMVRAGAFGAEGAAIIRAALDSVTAPAMLALPA